MTPEERYAELNHLRAALNPLLDRFATLVSLAERDVIASRRSYELARKPGTFDVSKQGNQLNRLLRLHTEGQQHLEKGLTRVLSLLVELQPPAPKGWRLALATPNLSWEDQFRAIADYKEEVGENAVQARAAGLGSFGYHDRISKADHARMDRMETQNIIAYLERTENDIQSWEYAEQDLATMTWSVHEVEDK